MLNKSYEAFPWPYMHAPLVAVWTHHTLVA